MCCFFLIYAQHHLQCVLLQVVWLPKADILDVGGQAAASIVSVVQHYSLQLAVQCVDSERRWGWRGSAGWLNRQAGMKKKKKSSDAGASAHPLARFSMPQYSSASSLQGGEVALQPTSSDMSPQSSSPLHCRVLGMQRPGSRESGRSV